MSNPTATVNALRAGQEGAADSGTLDNGIVYLEVNCVADRAMTLSEVETHIDTILKSNNSDASIGKRAILGGGRYLLVILNGTEVIRQILAVETLLTRIIEVGSLQWIICKALLELAHGLGNEMSTEALATVITSAARKVVDAECIAYPLYYAPQPPTQPRGASGYNRRH
ncbi:hypothetical protein HK097_002972 [Rhizophlyctis rosea]|uniref:Uncharacterized protein n=1 Tax=Rhizophlyctis rosea TaxID=64517 RepID=A0AAD5S4U2_9FUNG|nr:hypothetical protein HK097_002972 [Rhizophlyctis rosea]